MGTGAYSHVAPCETGERNILGVYMVWLETQMDFHAILQILQLFRGLQ